MENLGEWIKISSPRRKSGVLRVRRGCSCCATNDVTRRGLHPTPTPFSCLFTSRTSPAGTSCPFKCLSVAGVLDKLINLRKAAERLNNTEVKSPSNYRGKRRGREGGRKGESQRHIPHYFLFTILFLVVFMCVS